MRPRNQSVRSPVPLFSSSASCLKGRDCAVSAQRSGCPLVAAHICSCVLPPARAMVAPPLFHPAQGGVMQHEVPSIAATLAQMSHAAHSAQRSMFVSGKKLALGISSLPRIPFTSFRTCSQVGADFVPPDSGLDREERLQQLHAARLCAQVSQITIPPASSTRPNRISVHFHLYGSDPSGAQAG